MQAFERIVQVCLAVPIRGEMIANIGFTGAVGKAPPFVGFVQNGIVIFTPGGLKVGVTVPGPTGIPVGKDGAGGAGGAAVGICSGYGP
jgi:hypothetical protein